MPELPEVETIRKTLSLLTLNKTVKDITIHWPKIIKQPDDTQAFRAELIGETLQTIERSGKFLRFYFDTVVLVSHLRMEGKYRLVETNEALNKHDHILFHFTDGTELRYNDVRKFGTMHIFPIGEEFKHAPLNKLGPDPFQDAYTLPYVMGKLILTSRPIKAALLDQMIIAGLGNIYVDEVLFLSGVHPETRANVLSETDIKNIYENAHIVLKKAVKQGGTTVRSYVDGQGEMGMFQQELYVYGQETKACKTCGDEIIKLKVAGRGTHICPSCQTFKEGKTQ